MQIARIMIVCACLTAFAAGHARADQPSPEKRAEIERLLETTGALAMAQQVTNYFITSLAQSIKRQNPSVPQEVVNALPEEVNAVVRDNLESFRGAVIIIYSRHFTVDELRSLNTFYASDAGKKVISVMPKLMQESMAAGSAWGQTLQPQIVERLRARFKKENLQI